MIRRSALLVLGMLALLLTTPVAQAETCPKTSLPAIQDEVMCPICGVPLGNANGPSAEDQRTFIRERVDKCESTDQIKAALVAEYGDRVLAVPAKSGFDLTAWLVPIIVLIAAFAGIAIGAVQWRRSRGGEPLPEGASGPDSAELDADLQRYDL